MKVLILTNHFKEYSGSEIQALEIYKYFKQNNISVKIYANALDQQLTQHIDIKDIIENINNINIQEFNFIWAQHAIFAMLFKNKPFLTHGMKIFSVHLSPYELLELTSINYMKEIGAIFLANSEETKEKLLEFNVDSGQILVTYNCAPQEFEKDIIPHKINNILAISNHLPNELSDALSKLKSDFNVDIIGTNHKKILISSEFINKYDLIISIGKSVQYGILSNKFIYCYDRFGGPGFLTDSNFEKAKYYNFSGRGFEKKISSQIYNEIKKFDPSQYPQDIDKNDFKLDSFMNKIRSKPDVFLTQKDIEVLHMSYPIENLFTQYYQSSVGKPGSQTKLKKYRNLSKISSLVIIILFALLISTILLK